MLAIVRLGPSLWLSEPEIYRPGPVCFNTAELSPIAQDRSLEKHVQGGERLQRVSCSSIIQVFRETPERTRLEHEALVNGIRLSRRFNGNSVLRCSGTGLDAFVVSNGRNFGSTDLVCLCLIVRHLRIQEPGGSCRALFFSWPKVSWGRRASAGGKAP